MSRRSCPSIPQELHQLKAHEVYEQRIAKGKNGSPEGDWETARRYLTIYPKLVRAWKRERAIAFYRQLLRSFFRRLTRSFKALIGVIEKIITFPFWLPFKLNRMFASADTRSFALDVVKTIATFAAAIGLFMTYRNASLDRQLSQERLVTDRFAKAVEQIGSKEEEVIIGGIYSLERITKDSPKDQWTIMEVLTAFVRKNSSIPPEIVILEQGSEEQLKALAKLRPVNIQVQAALTVIGRRDLERDYTSDEDSEQNIKRLDLSTSNLNFADFGSADLRSANLSLVGLYRADLRSADLRSANLTDADLRSANLTDADLRSASLSFVNLDHAKLKDVNLESADLRGANLSLASLYRANLRSADFIGADLMNANLNDANLSFASLYRANLRSTELIYADLMNANLNDANLSFASLYRANLRSVDLRSADLADADLSFANLTDAKLDDVKNLSNEQIKSACFWEKAIYTSPKWNEVGKKWIAVYEKANQKRIEEVKRDKASDPKDPPDCSMWK